MIHSKPIIFAAALAMLASLLACGLGTPLPPKPTLAPETPTGTAGPVTPTIPPTEPPTPTQNLAPTALPAPTQIQPPTAAPTDAAGTGTPGASGSSSPSITLNPAVGEPLDVTIVNGSGWPAKAHVVLAWSPTKGPSGPSYWELDADDNGTFNVDLKVPPADKWPGGAPSDRTLIQLRATSDAVPNWVAWANFTYIKRFVVPTKGPTGPSETPQPTVTATARP